MLSVAVYQPHLVFMYPFYDHEFSDIASKKSLKLSSKTTMTSNWPNVGTQTRFGALPFDLNSVQGISESMYEVIKQVHYHGVPFFIMKKNGTLGCVLIVECKASPLS